MRQTKQALQPLVVVSATLMVIIWVLMFLEYGGRQTIMFSPGLTIILNQIIQMSRVAYLSESIPMMGILFAVLRIN